MPEVDFKEAYVGYHSCEDKNSVNHRIVVTVYRHVGGSEWYWQWTEPLPNTEKIRASQSCGSQTHLTRPDAIKKAFSRADAFYKAYEG